MRRTPTYIWQPRHSCKVLATICALLSPLTLAAQAQTKAVPVRPQVGQAYPKPLAQLPVHGRIVDLKFAPVGSLLCCLAELRIAGAKGSYNETHEWQLQVWDTRTRKLKWSVTRPFLISFDFSPDSTRVAFLESTRKPTVDEPTDNPMFLKPQPGERIQIRQSQSGALGPTILVPDGSSISPSWEGVQFADNQTLFLKQRVSAKDRWEGRWFDTQTGKCVRTVNIAEWHRDDITLPLVPTNTKQFRDAAVFTDGILLSPGGKTLLVDLQTSQSPPDTTVGKSFADRVGYGQGHARNTHHLWLCNLNGEFERQIANTPHLTFGFSFDGALLIGADSPQSVQIFDVQPARLLRTLAVPKRYSILFADSTNFIHGTDGLISHDGKRAFATLAQGGTLDKETQVGMWDITSGRFLTAFATWPTNSTSCTLALSRDDTILAHPALAGSNHSDEYIQLWKLK